MESELHILCDKYLAKELTPSELAEFETRLQTDAEFRTEVETYLKARKVIQTYGREKMAGEIRDQYGQFLQNRKRTRNLWTYSSISVAAALLILLAVWLPGKQDAGKWAESWISNTEAPAMRSGTPGADSLLREAHSRFNAGKFEEAIQAYLPLAEDPAFTRSSEAIYFLGLSYLKGGKATEAVPWLQKAEYPYVQEAEWYLTLAWLQAGQTDSVSQMLDRIESYEGHAFAKPAKELKKKMK
jgi:tetratricopeptide (TPR) repeat protein